MNPFVYPIKQTRRHGPLGYLDYTSYKPWLRDEFEFRCVYCLRREQLGTGVSGFAVDHFLPISIQPDAELKYLNLFYSCSTCNFRKGSRRIDDPTDAAVASELTVYDTGQIVGETPAARRLIREISGAEHFSRRPPGNPDPQSIQAAYHPHFRSKRVCGPMVSIPWSPSWLDFLDEPDWKLSD